MAINKKSLILECVRLGMDFYSAALAVSCSKEEIKTLENDEDFQYSVEVNNTLLEKDLLEDHNRVTEMCVDRGIAAPLQWKLERVNPGRWGGRTKIDLEKPIVGELTINNISGKDKE
ncbi:hypothetical protein LCGC14_3046690 [marine sediment metagenome]|uniref:Uncharacterized protein n=1 Tax=marine sediment metagenome TaxID=412755 RepID=A0A0F8XB60_9ZZZZ